MVRSTYTSIDGTRIMRHPFDEADIGVNIASSPIFQGFLSEHSGSFVRTSVRDGVKRHYTFTRVGNLPLILNVASSTSAVEADWRTKATVIGSIVLVLCGMAITLSLLFGRELRRREAVQAELERLSVTDPLTGLSNRRAFEAAGSRALGACSTPPAAAGAAHRRRRSLQAHQRSLRASDRRRGPEGVGARPYGERASAS